MPSTTFSGAPRWYQGLYGAVRGCTGHSPVQGMGGMGTTSPSPPSSTDPAPLSIPFIDSFHKQKLAERRQRLSPAPGLPETGMRGGGRPFASRDRAPPAACITGASTAQTLCYKATLPNTHRGAPPGRGGTGWDREGGSCPALPGAERCGGESTGERTGRPWNPPRNGEHRRDRGTPGPTGNGRGRITPRRGGAGTGLPRGSHRSPAESDRSSAGWDRGAAGPHRGAGGTHREPRERRDRTRRGLNRFQEKKK